MKYLQDCALSLKAKGLYTLIHSCIGCDKPSQLDLIKLHSQHSDAETSAKTALKELKENGYIKLIKVQAENGRGKKSFFMLLSTPDTTIPYITYKKRGELCG